MHLDFVVIEAVKPGAVAFSSPQRFVKSTRAGLISRDYRGLRSPDVAPDPPTPARADCTVLTILNTTCILNLDFTNLDFPNLDFTNLDFPNLDFPNLNFLNLDFRNLDFLNLDFPNLASQCQYKALGISWNLRATLVTPQPVLLLMFLAPLLICCSAEEKPVDCSDILQHYLHSSSGVYTIYPFHRQLGVSVYCDMETDGGGWTIIQRRMDGSVNFYRPWDQYVEGFGDANGEYWFGLEFMHKITARGRNELLVEMEDFDGNKASARYSSFSVGPECDQYKLTVSGFTDGGAGDSLTEHNNMKFTTFDNDQDTWPNNCAKSFLGGFWYTACHSTNPNGIYRWGADGTIYAIGVSWSSWKGNAYSLKSISFKIRLAK
ncbi:hypothetical protein WMY93_028222 [Mugilogobius chulae]|uniref:Fibrinogen C-terminal domain-containing protein n=1 Tax=Mugilogobius chulae TaxID=88201 RepID=A0AAW0MZU5_9GOBI